MKLISVVSPCYNEEGNVEILVERVRELFANLPQYRYEHIIIDNHSTDRTVDILRGIAKDDPKVKVIVNARNFGHIRSPQHAFLQAKGDAVVVLLSDLQDPPEMILDFLREWEAGFPIVVAIKNTSDENGLMYRVRSAYYRTVARLTDVKVLEHFTGFGLYDRQVVDILRRDFQDPQPYFRGQIAEIGLPHKALYYHQKRRMRGITKNNFYTLYDMAMLGITNLSKVPLRLVIFGGFVFAFLSLARWIRLPDRQAHLLEPIPTWPGTNNDRTFLSRVGTTRCARNHRGVCRIDPYDCPGPSTRYRKGTH